MCPFCLASLGMIVASATSAGGLTVLAAKLSQTKILGREVIPSSSASSMTGQDRRIGQAANASKHADATSNA
jgi:hypothetical protein